MRDVSALVHRFYDVLWNAWDDDEVADTLHPDLRFCGSLGQETVGLDQWRGYRSGAAFFTSRDGLLADIWVVGDLAGLREQLG